MGEAMVVGMIVTWATLTAAWHLAPAHWRKAWARRLQTRAECDGGALVHAAAMMAARPAGACTDCGARRQCPLARSAGHTATLGSDE
jgi:hypothetical protein